ncbi:hypothetical protein O181_029708 [Austropuccinia psidii MF-1]|uniref:Uncharacterized protein n=1 Tax=Austropuccinia psidii MF-1 TaxID=1389203 RepID=A0A9Q3CU27_9BASI|nr:hypothetical protein [Austropuccinia psidii MF-1]
MRNHKLQTQLPGEVDHAVKCKCNPSFTLDDIAKILQDVSKRKNIGKYFSYKGNSFNEKQPFRVKNKDKPRKKVAELTKKKKSCPNCGSTDHFSNKGSNPIKNIYSIEQVPEEEIQEEDFESDSMGDSIREHSDDDQEPIEEVLAKYKEETPLEIEDIDLEAGLAQDTPNTNLSKQTQDVQMFLVTQTKGME